VNRLCKLVEVERSSYYAWVKATPAREARAAADVALADRIRKVHSDETRAVHRGSPPSSTTVFLLISGSITSPVARVMRDNDIPGGIVVLRPARRDLPGEFNTMCMWYVGYRRRRKVRTTIPEPADQKVPDLLNRDFTAPAPNLRYVGDITYLPLADGNNLDLATVIDSSLRRLAGWSIANHMRTELVTDALKAAQATRGNLAGAVFHSDRAVSTPPAASGASAPDWASPSPWGGPGRRWTMGDRGVAFHRGVRTAQTRALHHVGPGPRPGRDLDRGVQPRPAPLRARDALPDRLRTPAATSRKTTRQHERPDPAHRV
jgi:hypothetical protein